MVRIPREIFEVDVVDATIAACSHVFLGGAQRHMVDVRAFEIDLIAVPPRVARSVGRHLVCAPRRPGNFVIAVRHLPNSHHAPTRSGQCAVHVPHQCRASRTAAFDGPRQLHVEAAAVQEEGTQSGEGAAHGVACEEDLVDLIFVHSWFASALPQGCQNLGRQGLLPRRENAFVRSAPRACRVVQEHLLDLSVHLFVLVVGRASEDEHTSLRGHEEGRAREGGRGPADECGIEEQGLAHIERQRELRLVLHTHSLHCVWNDPEASLSADTIPTCA
mmetsp:Transcript_70195/g.182077  ORF Transcript_70195/g.182077 Transcript_70195/m.182077 type:complete len:275 (-) Transcript_70195:776-1600(-)